ncbi:hypothetical protein OHA32_40005, partial [Streptomyces erythrochromogenes]|nr:hypothetical protein [Streptomyces erythrochromogenes]
RRSEADPWVQIPPGHVTNGGTPLTAWPVSMTSGRTPALVWNTTDTVDPDGSVQIKADFTGPAGATGATQPLAVVVDRNASGAATSPVGPGTLNLLTGDFEVSATDVSAFGMSVSRTTSSRDPHKGAKQEGQAAIFGQEWASGTAAEIVQSDYSHVARVSDTAVDVVTTSGDALHFTANAARTGWVSEPGAGSMTLTGSLSGSFTLTDDGGTITEFTRGDPAMTTWQVSSTLVSGVENSTTTVVSETVTVETKKLARPKRVIAPTSAATTSACATTPQTKGCRSLEFVYATATTATGYSTSADFGDFAGQVKEIRLWSTEPGAANATSKAVSTYRYDAGGNLRQQWDPNLAQSTQAQYAYNAADRIDWLQTKSELPWSFTYGQAGSSPTAGDGMLLKSSRAGLKPGTAGRGTGHRGHQRGLRRPADRRRGPVPDGHGRREGLGADRRTHRRDRLVPRRRSPLVPLRFGTGRLGLHAGVGHLPGRLRPARKQRVARRTHHHHPVRPVRQHRPRALGRQPGPGAGREPRGPGRTGQPGHRPADQCRAPTS